MTNIEEIEVNISNLHKRRSHKFNTTQNLKQKLKKILLDNTLNKLSEGLTTDELTHFFIENTSDSSNGVQDLFRSFIIDQMIFSNYEIYSKGQEILVSHNNTTLVSDKDIKEYVENNKKLIKYLKILLMKYIYQTAQQNVDRIVQHICDTLLQKIKTLTLATVGEYLSNQYYPGKSGGQKYKEPLNSKSLEYYIEYQMEDYRGILSDGVYYDLFSHDTYDNFDILLDSTIYIQGFDAFEEYLRKNFYKTGIIMEIDRKSNLKKDVYFLREFFKHRATSKSQLVREYPESKIKQILTKWNIPEDSIEAREARDKIARFEQIKNNVESKRDTLPGSITGNIKDLRDIDQYPTYQQLLNLLNAYGEKADKIKKEAIEKFKKEGAIESAQGYVSRFMSMIQKLRNALVDGMEDQGNGEKTKEQVAEVVPERLKSDYKFIDPRNYTWEEFEKLVDELFPIQYKKSETGEEATVMTDADLIYNKNGIEVYKGDDYNKCYYYNYGPVVSPGTDKKYGHCVMNTMSMYDSYRFREYSPTFYFIIDRSRSTARGEGGQKLFEDKWHLIVLQVYDEKGTKGGGYVVTSAQNDSDILYEKWEDIGTGTTKHGREGMRVPSDLWNKIKGLESVIKPIPLSRDEQARKLVSGRDYTWEQFLELDDNLRGLYIQGKASKDQLPEEFLRNITKMTIQTQDGKKENLANLAINSGQTFTYDILKNYDALARRYAIYRSRHTLHGARPVPISFVKYLDEEPTVELKDGSMISPKEKYLEDFKDKNLTFEYIEKYFGPKLTEKYVNETAKSLKFLPKEAISYITDPTYKKLYGLLTKLHVNWVLDKETNIPEEVINSMIEMPSQRVSPVSATLKDWQKLDTKERSAVVELTEKYSGKKEYSELLLILPLVIKDGNQAYVLIPENITDDKYYYTGNFILADLNGNVVEKLNSENWGLKVSGSVEQLALFYNSGYDPDTFKKVYNRKDLVAL